MTECPGPCNRSYRRAQNTYRAELVDYRRQFAEWRRSNLSTLGAWSNAERPWRPAAPDVRAVAGDPVWCRRCRIVIRLALAEMDDLVAVLASQIDGMPPPARARLPVGAPGSGPAGPDVRLDLLDEAKNLLTDWEETFRRYRGWPPRPRRGRYATTMIRTVAWLAQHLDELLTWRARADEFGHDVMVMHRRLQDATELRADTVRKPMPCPRCGTRQLVLVEADRPDDRRIECQGEAAPGRRCGRVMTMDEYDAYVEVYAQTTPRVGSGA